MNGSVGSALRAMVWKEWRENGKWAMLAAIGLMLGILINVTETHGPFYYVVKVFEAYWAGFGLAMSAGSLIVAAALPFLQIFPEKRRDQWAFLIHRPASRGTLFWGKALAGVSLYLAATLVPAIIVGIWAATPGNLPGPFDLHFLSPALRSVAAGVLLYFGALLTALRPARWYGSRAVPALLAAVGAFGVSNGLSLFFLLPLGAAFITAAWGAFLADGDDSRQPLAGRIALRATLYAGFLGICLGAVGAVDSAYRTAHPYEGEATMEGFAVVRPNHIVRETYTRLKGSAVSYTLARLQGVDGREYPIDLHHPRQDDWLTFGYSLPTGDSHGSNDGFSFVTPINTYPELNRPHLSWYYIADKRWMEIYSLESRRLVGRFGPDGYRSVAEGTPRPFDDVPVSLADDRQPGIFAFRRHVYRLNSFDARGHLLPIEDRRLSLIYSAPPHTDILSTTVSTKIHPNANLAYVLTTTRGVQLLGGDGSPIALLSWGRGGAQNESVDADIVPQVDRSTANPDHYFFWFWPLDIHQPPTAAVTEVSGRGRVMQRVSMMRTAIPLRSDSPWYGLGAPLAAASIAAMSVSGSDKSVGAKLIAISLVTALACAALAWWLGARRGAGRRVQWAWIFVGFLLGPAALLTLIALRPWPARVNCPNCGKPRAVTHNLCEHLRCGVPAARA